MDPQMWRNGGVFCFHWPLSWQHGVARCMHHGGRIRFSLVSNATSLQVDLEVSVVDDEGLRGTRAVRDMQKNQIAVHLPAHLAVELGQTGVPSEVCIV